MISWGSGAVILAYRCIKVCGIFIFLLVITGTAYNGHYQNDKMPLECYPCRTQILFTCLKAVFYGYLLMQKGTLTMHVLTWMNLVSR